MARPQSEALAGRETRRRGLKLVPVSANVFEESSPLMRRRRHTQSGLLDQERVFTPVDMPPTTLVNTGSFTQVIQAELTTPKQKETKKPRRQNKQKPIILALMRLNATHTGPEFSSLYDEKFIVEIYRDKVLDENGKKIRTKVRSNAGSARQSIDSFIAILEHPERDSAGRLARALTLVDEIRNMYPYYKNLTISQIFGFLKRTADFSEILKPATDPTEKGLPDDFTATEEKDRVMNLPIWKPIISDPTPPDIPLFLRHLREVNTQLPGDNYLGTPVRNPPQGWRPISNEPLNNRE